MEWETIYIWLLPHDVDSIRSIHIYSINIFSVNHSDLNDNTFSQGVKYEITKLILILVLF